MGRGGKKNKKKGNRGGGGDDDDGSDEEEEAAPATEAAAAGGGGAGASRKQKRLQKQQAKQQQKKNNDDDDDDNLAMLLGGNKKNQYGSDDNSDDEDAPLPKKGKKKGGAGRMATVPSDSEEEEPPPQPVGKKKKGAAARLAAMAANDDDSDDDDSEEEDDGDDGDGGEVEQVAFTMIADDWGSPKKKKKDKKNKKEASKKDKKKKGKDNADDEESDGVADTKKKKKKKKSKDNNKNAADEESDGVAEAMEKKKKSKFELQMEAAMQKKEEEDAPEAQEPSSKKDKGGKKQQLASKEDEPHWVDTTNKAKEEEEEFYGHDDVVWSDKSHAQKAAEEAGGEDAAVDDDHSMLYGPDGKKLSNKERKRLLKQQQAAEREAAFQETAAQASRQGAQFACSQTAVNENDPTWQNALDVTIPSFTISAAGKILFQDASLVIGQGRRYGLVGPNGKGKSTLLKMIASRDLKLPPRIDFLYVEQEVVADDTPAVEAVLRADERRWELLQEEAELLKKVDNDDIDIDLDMVERLQTVTQELTNMGSDAAEAKARRILYGLGFTPDMQTKPTRMFSGGWRMRISLARALFMEPTLLMLDEPTNHLDLNAVIWLDEYLTKWKKTLFVVSHDQDFLNSVCQEILHIEDLKLISYKGNYDSFKKAEHTKFLQAIKAWEKQEKRLKELKRQGQSKTKAQETLKKSKRGEAGAAAANKKKNQAVAAGTEAQETKELLKRPREYAVKLEFAEVAELSRPVMQVQNVHFRYSPKHPVIFDCVDFGIDMSSRICIVGPNGAGKSTLLKLLTGELEPTTGEVRRNPRLRMGIYNQHFVDRLPMSKTPVEHLRDRFQDEDYQSVRNRLGKYGLEGHAHEVTMRDLSGGQKARVVFVELSLQRPHILLLDEPTNNLDIETIDALCDAINQFNGGIVVVTHDSRLIEECDCNLWVVEKQGVTQWDLGFDDYRETILRELEEQVQKEATQRFEKLQAAAKLKAEKIAKLAQKIKNKK